MVCSAPGGAGGRGGDRRGLGGRGRRDGDQDEGRGHRQSHREGERAACACGGSGHEALRIL
ncbi:hypothetical protein SFR_5846 [Streptomyces sp. FR-008]|nr:hypothetical protein SFR_5846 [Streptomyces sp. FR-008]